MLLFFSQTTHVAECHFPRELFFLVVLRFIMFYRSHCRKFSRQYSGPVFRLLRETPPYQVIVGTHCRRRIHFRLRLTTKRYKKGAKLLFLFFLRRRPVTTEVEVSVICFLGYWEVFSRRRRRRRRRRPPQPYPPFARCLAGYARWVLFSRR